MSVVDLVVQWLVPAMCGGFVTALAIAWKWGRAIVGGLKALLRADLNRIHRDYVQNGIPVPIEVKDEADDIYSAYHALGGNSVGTHLHDEIIAAHSGDVRR